MDKSLTYNKFVNNILGYDGTGEGEGHYCIAFYRIKKGFILVLTWNLKTAL